MQNGGLFPVGPYDEMMAPKQGNYLLPDINRPSYIDDEGGRRSEYKMGVNIDGKETLLPTVVGGRQLTEDQAEAQYMRTGLNMGKFNNVEDADYASRLRTARYNMLEDPIRFQANQFQEGGYTIAPGDTFYGIANKFGVTRKEMTGSNPDVNFEKIKAGQRLRVPETFNTTQEYPTGYFETMASGTFNVMGKPIPKVVPKPQAVSQPTSNIQLGPDIFLKQAYAESTFNPKAKSPAGYMGLAQIGNDVITDYKKATGVKKVDPYNPSDNAKVQKWAMNQIYNSEFVNKDGQSEDVRLAKTLASYNWGKGNVRNYLAKQKKKGVDIYNSMDWVEDLPKETRDYIHKIQIGDMQQFEKDFTKARGNKANSQYINLYKQKYGGLQQSYKNTKRFK
jgi:hypothetical protein